MSGSYQVHYPFATNEMVFSDILIIFYLINVDFEAVFKNQVSYSGNLNLISIPLNSIDVLSP